MSDDLLKNINSLADFYRQAATQDDFWDVLARAPEELKVAKLKQLLREYYLYDGKVLDQALAWIDNNRDIRAQNAELFGDPLDLAFGILSEKRPFETIIAGLLASSIQSLNVDPDDYRKDLEEVERQFGARTRLIANDAIRMAYEHRPVLHPDLEAKFRQDEIDFRREMEAEREKKKAHDRAEFEKKEADPSHTVKLYKIKKRKTLRQVWNENYISMIESQGYMPEAIDVRLCQRRVLLRKIDPDKPVSRLDLNRLGESYEVHSHYALAQGLWEMHNWLGDLYVKIFQREAYNAINSFMANLDTAIAEFQNPVTAANKMIVAALEARGFKRAETAEGVGKRGAASNGNGGDFHFSQRKKGIFQIWKKLHEDGIDPVEFLSRFFHQTSARPDQQAVILYEHILKDNLFDLFGLRNIVDPLAVVRVLKAEVKTLQEKEEKNEADYELLRAKDAECKKIQQHIDDGKWRKAEGAACYHIQNFIGEVVARSGSVVCVPERDRDYIREPKPNDYRSLHKGLAVRINIPALGLYDVLIPIELQIRTADMHEAAEHGRSAWLVFKNKGNADNVSWKDASHQVGGAQHVHVVTPKGDIKIFPKGATVWDFASRLGLAMVLMCKGAIIRSRFETWHPLDRFRVDHDTGYFVSPDQPLPNGVTISLIKDDWVRDLNTAESPEERAAVIRKNVTPETVATIRRHVESSSATSMLDKFIRSMRTSYTKAISKLELH